MIEQSVSLAKKGHQQGMQHMGILLTRPLEDSLAFVRAIKSFLPAEKRPHTKIACYIQPLLFISPLHPPPFEYNGEEIIFSSRHGVHFFIRNYGKSYLQSSKIWCVGQTTKKTLHDYGCTHLQQSSPNGEDLLKNIKNTMKAGVYPRKFIHVRGKDVTVDFQKELFPHCSAITLYKTTPAPCFRKSIAQAFKKNNIHIIVLFSKKSAHTLHSLLHKTFTSHEKDFGNITFLGLSPNVLSVFPQNLSSVCATTEDMLKTIEKFILKNEQGVRSVKEIF